MALAAKELARRAKSASAMGDYAAPLASVRFLVHGAPVCVCKCMCVCVCVYV
jgi:hypothetical protein